jgi:hypothetical protein
MICFPSIEQAELEVPTVSWTLICLWISGFLGKRVRIRSRNVISGFTAYAGPASRSGLDRKAIARPRARVIGTRKNVEKMRRGSVTMLKINPGNLISIKRKRGKPTNGTKPTMHMRRSMGKVCDTRKTSAPKL